MRIRDFIYDPQRKHSWFCQPTGMGFPFSFFMGVIGPLVGVGLFLTAIVVCSAFLISVVAQ